MRISDWSSDVCSSDLAEILERGRLFLQTALGQDVALALVELSHGLLQQLLALAEFLGFAQADFLALGLVHQPVLPLALAVDPQRRVQRVVRRGEARSEEHTSELQSLMRISYAVFC